MTAAWIILAVGLSLAALVASVGVLARMLESLIARVIQTLGEITSTLVNPPHPEPHQPEQHQNVAQEMFALPWETIAPEAPDLPPDVTFTNGVPRVQE